MLTKLAKIAAYFLTVALAIFAALGLVAAIVCGPDCALWWIQ